MQWIHVERDFVLPVGRVFAYLSEHENLGPLFGARVTRLRDGQTSRNGVGSVRSLKVGPLPAFEETVTLVVPDERIDYRISRGGLLRDHSASMRFTPPAGGTHLVYDIEFGALAPGLDRVVKLMLERSMRAGLADVDSRA